MCACVRMRTNTQDTFYILIVDAFHHVESGWPRWSRVRCRGQFSERTRRLEPLGNQFVARIPEHYRNRAPRTTHTKRTESIRPAEVPWNRWMESLAASLFNVIDITSWNIIAKRLFPYKNEVRACGRASACRWLRATYRCF